MAAAPPLLPERFATWFAGRGWEARSHQLDMVERAKAGRDALRDGAEQAGEEGGGVVDRVSEDKVEQRGRDVYRREQREVFDERRDGLELGPREALKPSRETKSGAAKAPRLCSASLRQTLFRAEIFFAPDLAVLVQHSHDFLVQLQ